VFIAAIAARVGRLPSDTRDTSQQRTTRSQTRLLGEKGRDASVKGSAGHKPGRVAVGSLALPEKAQSVDRGNTKQGRTRNLTATSSKASGGDNKAATTKVPHYNITEGSAAAAAVTSGKASRSATQVSEIMPPPVMPPPVMQLSPVHQLADAEEANADTTMVDENVFDKAAEFKPEAEASFETPGRSRRARSMMSPGLSFASVRKTPKNLRNSLLLRRMSPEEGYVWCIV